MMRTIKVIQTKNKLEKEERKKNIIKIRDLQREYLFNVKLNKVMQELEVLLMDKKVEEVVIVVEDDLLALFQECIYKEEMGKFKILQLEETNKFSVSLRKLYI